MTSLPTEKPMQVLVVDDDSLLNQLLCDFLHTKALHTCTATSLATASDILDARHHIDLILLDYELGDGNGLELVARLQHNTNILMPPVIMISVNEDPAFLERCFSAGVNDYIIKPINLSLLALKVRAMINAVAMQKIISAQHAELVHFKREAEREEAVAKFIYEYLLGQNTQDIDGVNLWLQSSSSFSGDIALVRRSPSGDLYFMLADATGHGLSAAITIMPAVAIFNSMVAKGFHIQSIVAELNKKLVQHTPVDRFVAALIVQIQPEQQEMRVWNGAMPTAYWVNQGVLEHAFPSRHMALGILDEENFDASVETYHFPVQGYLFACSDGLLEEANPNSEAFSVHRVQQIIAAQPINLQHSLMAALRQHTGHEQYRDDISICTLEPSKMLLGEACALRRTDRLFTEDGNFLWQLQLSGKKIANCEIAPLANKFLLHVGANKDFCQIIFLILSELISNAVDHGILRLDSRLKVDEKGFDFYFKERERRLAHLTEKDTVQLSLRWSCTAVEQALVIEVLDSGEGYEPSLINEPNIEQSYGRGLSLVHQLASRVDILPPGNCTRVVIEIATA